MNDNKLIYDQYILQELFDTTYQIETIEGFVKTQQLNRCL